MALFMIGPRTARFAVLALPFLLVGILYDNLRLVLHLRGEIHVADLYALEKSWFSVVTEKGAQILPEFFRDHPVVAFDLVCGLAYLAYLGESFLFGVYLFFRDQTLLAKFAWAFFAVNLLGMITYLIYPAAPPWYVEQYGLGPAVLSALPSAAGAARFDELTGLDYFRVFYSRNANVFGAMPSLHVAYPTLVIFTAWKLGKKWSIPAIAFALLVAFSAVYLRHHYVLDILAGAAFAAIAWGLVTVFESWRARSRESEAR
jgi:membrane-associated phospholipid phosphatase